MTEISQLSDDQVLSIRDAALLQLQFDRDYVLNLLESTPRELWYDMPAGYHSNVAWQVGHLAVSQYGLLLYRQRGRGDNDMQLMPGWFRKKFSRGTSPTEINSELVSIDDLLARFDLINNEARKLAPTLTAASLREPIDMPYAGYPCKLGAIVFCPLHEMIHAGQIGLLRRGLGLEPVR